MLKFIKKLQNIKVKNYRINVLQFTKAILILFCIIYTITDFTNSLIKCNTNNIKVETKQVSYKNYVVMSGDTLWNIAEDLNKNVDTRILVEIIKKDNNLLNSNIKKGQVLKIRED